MCSEPSSDVWATFAVELAGSTTLLVQRQFHCGIEGSVGPLLGLMPETLPTVTSSTMTGEFCGSVATSANSTVIE